MKISDELHSHDVSLYCNEMHAAMQQHRSSRCWQQVFPQSDQGSPVLPFRQI